MSQRLLVAGAINTDLVATMDRAPERGETISAHRFDTFGGGKGANQAVSAARNGVRVSMLGACGRDANGTARIADLQSAGIDTGWVRIDEVESSGVALIFVETDGDNRIAYVPGATNAIPRAYCLECYSAVRPKVLLATNELPLVNLHAIMTQAQADGVHVTLNATPEPERALKLLPLVHTMIVNEGEARALIGISADRELDAATIQPLLALGPETVVVTRGADGAIAFTVDRAHSVAPPIVHVVDTTGAGDAFCGAFAAAQVRGDDLERSLRIGVFAGSLATERAGAQTSSPTLDVIETAMRRTGGS